MHLYSSIVINLSLLLKVTQAMGIVIEEFDKIILITVYMLYFEGAA